MPSIYLVRHAKYDNPHSILPGRLPVELSTAGKQQAERLRDYFADKQIGTIYSSAVERCKQTAGIIADGAIPIIYDQRLLEGLSAYQGYWDKNWHGNGFHFFSHQSELGGESLDDVRRRVANFWDELAATLSQNVIICSHGDPLYLLYCHACQLQPPQDYGQSSLDPPGYLEKGAFGELTLENGAIARIMSSVTA